MDLIPVSVRHKSISNSRSTRAKEIIHRAEKQLLQDRIMRLKACLPQHQRKYGIQTHFKGNRTLKQVLVRPKDQNPTEKKSGAVYMYQCVELACDEKYLGEISTTMGERFKEHLKELSPIHAHSTKTGHNTTPENFNIIGRDDHGLARTTKESIYIRVNNPTLNRNIGRYNLHHIWDRV